RSLRDALSMRLREDTYSIQSVSAEKNTSAFAPASICLASTELAAYENFTCWPVSLVYAAPISLSASVSDDAANTSTGASAACTGNAARNRAASRPDAIVRRVNVKRSSPDERADSRYILLDITIRTRA